MDSISYIYISLTIHGMWLFYITFERGGPKFSNTTARMLPLCTAVQQRQLRAKWLLCSTRILHVSEENVRRIQERFQRSPRKSTRRASRELGIPQPTVWRVLRRHLPFNWVYLFESPCTFLLLATTILIKEKRLFHLMLCYTLSCYLKQFQNVKKELPLLKKISGGYNPHKIQFWIIKQINYTHIYTCSHQHTKSKPQTKDNAILGTSTDTTKLNPILSILTWHMHFFISKTNIQ